MYTVVHCVAHVHCKEMQLTMMLGYSNPDYSRCKLLCISCLQSYTYKHVNCME